MDAEYQVSLYKLIKNCGLGVVYTPKDTKEIQITTNDVARPGLQLDGFYTYFDSRRIQIFGKMEFAFLNALDYETRFERFRQLLSNKIPALVITRDMKPFTEMVDLAKEYEVPLLTSKDSTSTAMSRITTFLNYELAPRITRHGVLVDVYGEGLLLLGESGVGKSEAAIELVKRGHRLVADDAVEIRKMSDDALIGTSPENIRHFIELRGIGIINARRLFGMGAVKVSQNIDMVVNIEQWDPNKTYSRMGLDDETFEILGVKIPATTIPVKPGRNLAVIFEVAAMNNREKKMGYNGALELLENLGMDPQEEIAQAKEQKED